MQATGSRHHWADGFNQTSDRGCWKRPGATGTPACPLPTSGKAHRCWSSQRPATSSRPHREPSIVGPRIHLCELPVTTNRQDVRRFMPALDRHLQPLYPAAYSHHRLWAQPEAAVATGRPTQVTRPVVLPLGPRGPEMHACRCSLPELAVSGREQLQCWLLVSGDC